MLAHVGTKRPVSRKGARDAGIRLSGGRPLDRHVRGEMEQRFAHNFADVRVHADSEASASARQLNAAAYTAGHDVVFSDEHFSEQSSAGKALLAHELTHVVQQSRGGVSATAAHEREAANASTRSERGVEPIANGAAFGVQYDEDKTVASVPKHTLINQVLGALGLPTGGRLAFAVLAGVVQEMYTELSGAQGKALLANFASFRAKDYPDLNKGFLYGLATGLISPITDLFGIAVLGEKLQGFVINLTSSVFSSRIDMMGESAGLLAGTLELAKAWQNAKKKFNEDPKATLLWLLTLPEKAEGIAEQLGTALGKKAGAQIVASLGEPFKAQEKKESRSFLAGPAQWLESKGEALTDLVADVPWAKIGDKIGYAIGWVAIQAILLAFTEGIGNAIEEVGVALGKAAGALGKISEIVGTGAAKVAEFITEVGKGIAVVEKAIGALAGKALKPFEPVLEPLNKLLGRFRDFLRKLFGVAEKDGAALLDAAAKKTGEELSDVASHATPGHVTPHVEHPPPPATHVEHPPPPATHVEHPPPATHLEHPPPATHVEHPPQVKPTTPEKPAPKPRKPRTTTPAKAPTKAGPVQTLDERIAAAERDVNVARKKTVDYQAQRRLEEKSLKGGPIKEVWDAKEELWVLRRAKAYPDRTLLKQARIVGVRLKDGTIKASATIAGQGRILDFAETQGDRLIGGDLKSASELMGSIEGGLKRSKTIEGALREGSKVGLQHQVEDKILAEAQKSGGKLVIAGENVRTGAPQSIDVAPGKYASTVVTYEDVRPN